MNEFSAKYVAERDRYWNRTVRGLCTDEDDMRCGLWTSQGDACSCCGTLVVRSFLTFKRLPLVRFKLAAGITDGEAARLLAAAPTTTTSSPVRHVSGPLILPENDTLDTVIGYYPGVR